MKKDYNWEELSSLSKVLFIIFCVIVIFYNLPILCLFIVVLVFVVLIEYIKGKIE